jgi:hypothetical protein
MTATINFDPIELSWHVSGKLKAEGYVRFPTGHPSGGFAYFGLDGGIYGALGARQGNATGGLIGWNILFDDVVHDGIDPDTGPINPRCRWRWEVSGPSYISGIYEGGFAAYQKLDDQWWLMSWACDCDYSISLSGLFDVKGEHLFIPEPCVLPDYCDPEQPRRYPWCPYQPDRDPCWLPPSELDIEYWLRDTASYSYTIGDASDSGIWSPTGDTTNASSIYLWLLADDDTDADPLKQPHSTKVVDATLTRTGLTTPNYEGLIYTNSPGDYDTRIEMRGNKIEAYVGGFGIRQEIVDSAGEVRVAYGNAVSYVDGSEIVEGLHAQIATGEYAPYWHPYEGLDYGRWDYSGPITANIGQTFPCEYRGYWQFITNAAGPYRIQGPNWIVPAYHGLRLVEKDGTKWRLHSAAEVITPGALGEPDFGGIEPNSYRDSRIDFAVPNAEWANAWKLTMPSTLRVLTFDALDWTAYNCNVTAVAGGIEVEVTGEGAYIQKIHDSRENSFQGARFCNFDFSVTGGDTVDLEVAGRQFQVSDSASEIDLLAPLNYSGADLTQSLVTSRLPERRSGELEVNPSWGWGVHVPGTVKISGLQEGKTYVINGFTLKRKSEPMIIIMPQASWKGNGESENDIEVWHEDPSMLYAGSGGTDTHPADTWYQRIGWVMVDGVVAGEIIGVKHIATDSEVLGRVWSIELPTTNQPKYMCYPPCESGWLSVSTDKDIVGVDGEDDFRLFIGWLKPGTYTGSNGSISISAQIRADRVYLPWAWPEMSIVGSKCYRGRALVRVVDSSGEYIPRNVQVQAGAGLNETDQVIQTNANGWAITPALNQLLGYTFTAQDAGTPLTGTTEGRNRLLSFITLKADMQALGDGNPISCCSSRMAGRVYRVDGRPTGCWLRIYDGGDAAYKDRQINDITDATAISLFCRQDLTAKLEQLVFIYDSAGSVYRITSVDEGKSWCEPVSIFTGKYPQAAYSPSELCEITAYLNETSGKVCVRRKLGDGTYGAEIEVCAAATDDHPAIVFQEAHKAGRWILFVRQANGSVSRYKSVDTGRTWALDE